jgi:hypothetical protein
MARRKHKKCEVLKVGLKEVEERSTLHVEGIEGLAFTLSQCYL